MHETETNVVCWNCAARVEHILPRMGRMAWCCLGSSFTYGLLDNYCVMSKFSEVLCGVAVLMLRFLAGGIVALSKVLEISIL